jgi:hypothetical protein
MIIAGVFGWLGISGVIYVASKLVRKYRSQTDKKEPEGLQIRVPIAEPPPATPRRRASSRNQSTV